MTDTSTAKHTPNLGDNMRRLRKERGWSAIKMCDVIGIKQSSLSKVENGSLSLNYDRLVEIADKLEIDITELFRADDSSKNSEAAIARISIDTGEGKTLHTFKNSAYQQLASEVKNRLMITTYAEINWTADETALTYGNYSGERFIYVIDGVVDFHSEYYETRRLNSGDSIYFDIRMKHNMTVPKNTTAKVLSVTASEDKKFMQVERVLASQGLSNIAELENH